MFRLFPDVDSRANAPLVRDLIAAAAGMLAFLALAALSYVDVAQGRAACMAALALAALADRRLIWALALFLVPFSRLFAFTAADMQALASVALAAAALRSLPAVLPGLRALLKLRSWYMGILLAFVLLVILHFTALSAVEIMGAGFLAATAILFLAALQAGLMSSRFLTLAEFAIVAGTLTAALLSAAFEYVPLPQLAVDCPDLYSARLNGVFDGPNAAARYLLVTFAVFLARALLDRKRQKRWVAGLLVTAVFMAMTKTKAALAALFLIFLLAGWLVPRGQRLRTLALSGGAVFIMFLWVAYVGLAVDHRAGEKWLAMGDQAMAGRVVDLSGRPLVDILRRQLRIGLSTEMKMNPATGKIMYGKNSTSLWRTGQRNYVWEAGLDTLRQHPLWGIGYKNWQQEMMRRLGFPFRGPHNGFLEVAGAYGVIGAALYILLALALARNLLRVRASLRTSPGQPALLWVTLAGAGLFAIELVDVSTSLALTLCAVWFWLMLGFQDGLLARK